MPTRPTTITAAAGEFYVAHQLSVRGFLVAIPRANVPSLDLLVSDASGAHSVSIQVKTSSGAWRDYKRTPERDHWEFDVGEKAMHQKSERLFYTFVDLNGGDGSPKVFVVPSHVVHEQMNDGCDRKRFMMWITAGEEKDYLERWDLVESALTSVK
ncbi:MAG: hypothetical protein LLG20_27895 [Acidobacteriales bacterium]|nr:hypothetical protein [Terriglobales bacterium]